MVVTFPDGGAAAKGDADIIEIAWTAMVRDRGTGTGTAKCPPTRNAMPLPRGAAWKRFRKTAGR
jgi:hypothetical protein